MIIIPGFLIAWLSFPGVIVHEAAHLLFCKLRRVAVFDVCYFRFGNPAGYVIHEEPQDFLSCLLICLGPLFINSLLCFVVCLPAFAPVYMFHRQDAVAYFLLWLGVSIGMHAFPSTRDATNLWHQSVAAMKRGNFLAVLALPLVLVIFLANFGSILWLDSIYGVALGLGLPYVIFKHLL